MALQLPGTFLEGDVSQVVVGAHGTGETGQEYTVTKEEIQDYLSYHSHLGQEMEESDIAQIIAEVPPLPFHLALFNGVADYMRTSDFAFAPSHPQQIHP